MNWKRLVVVIVVSPIVLLLFVLALVLFQKPSVALKVNGKTVAVVRQPFMGPILGDASADVYVGKDKIFSLWEDFFDGPIFVYPFADGKRFLCDYDDDTAMLDFVVDLRRTDSNTLNMAKWPLSYQVRVDLTRMATNVVFDTKGIIRLPSYAELQEVSSYLATPSQTRIKAGYFESLSFGTKEYLLLDLATNRDSYWPLVK